MSVLFGGYGNVDMNSVRYAMGIVDNATGPNRYESGDIYRIRAVYGGPGYAMSDYVGVNFFAYIQWQQGEGYVYDGCYGRDSWGWYDGTDQNGSYIGPWSGPSTYNSEFGYGAGTFLTFGYGLVYSYVRPYSYHNFVSYSSAPYNCRAFYVYISRNGGWVAFNGFAYAGGDQYTTYNFESGFQAYDYMYFALILWY
jgi:hypothetical protein